MRNISNSEVTTWLTCRMQYHFAFMRNLTPKVTPTPLARGTLGHSAFQRYIEARLEGKSHDAAHKASTTVFTEAMADISVEIVLETKFLYDRYMNFHQGWPQWRLLGTEQRYDLKITDTLSMPTRYDFYVEELSTSRKLVGDFKYTYDFWRPEDHDLNAQAPKYITVMQNNGLEVDGAFLEEIRTRKLGAEKTADSKNLWRRTFYYPSPAKKRSVIKQHIAASLEIESYRNASPQQQDALTIPALNKHGACKYCNFKDLCTSKLDGADIEISVELGYTENTYGYNKTEELMEIGDMI